MSIMSIGKIAVCICCIVSWVCNAIFGWGQGNTAHMSVVLCAGAVLLDVFKAFLPALASNCYRNGSLSAALACVPMYVLATTLSLLAAFGFYAQLLDAKTGSAKAEKLQYETLKKEKVTSQRELKALGKHRAVAAIKAEIDGEKSKERYWSAKLSNKCTNATAGKSKALCNKISALKVELAKAEDALPKIKRLEQRIDKLNNKLDEVDLEVVSKSNDAQIEGIAKNTGIDGGVVALLISIIFALAFELTSGLGFWVLQEGRDKEKEALKRNVTILENEKRDEKNAKIAAKQAAKSYKENAEDLNGINRFLKTCCTANATSNDFEKSADLFHAYESFVKQNAKDIPSPLKKITFGKALVEKGFVQDRLKERIDPSKPRGFRKIKLKEIYQPKSIEPDNVIPINLKQAVV